MSDIDTNALAPTLGVVVIGRNEGERLNACLTSLIDSSVHVVYVDSGSTDNSVELARRLGAEVVALDMSIPFTAARARNAGFQKVHEFVRSLSYVQFVDGDCEVAADWLQTAVQFMDLRPDVAVTCGRLRERYPEASVYNKLCDIEWNVPSGESRSCGGIAMYRARAFIDVGGFRSSMIAGEEPELCIRMRAGGWRIWRLDHEMAYHDAAMTHFKQWWNRTKRAGYAFAEGARLHGTAPERHYVRESRRAIFWGLVLPLLIVAVTVWQPVCLLIALAYPLQVIRLANSSDLRSPDRWIRATFLVIGKFPEMLGQFRYWSTNARKEPARLIEYK